MPWIPAAIIGGSALAGSLLGAVSGSSKSKRHNALEKYKLELAQWQWNKLFGEYEEAKGKYSKTAKRRYSAQRTDWRKKEALVDRFSKLYKQYEDDPTSVPQWQSFVDTATTKSGNLADQMKGALRRRGRTGGMQDKILGDIQTGLVEDLNAKMLEIQGTAREKQLQVEGMRSSRPFLDESGGPLPPSYGSGASSYSPGPQPHPTNIDLSGLGGALAYALRSKPQAGSGSSGSSGGSVDVWNWTDEEQ